MTGVRRAAVVVVVLAGVLALVLAGVGRPAHRQAVFADLGRPGTPFVPTNALLTSTFYCGGVPASGNGTGGEIVVVNPTAQAVTGRITVLQPEGDPIAQDVAVAPYASRAVRLDKLATADYLGAVVELDGAGGIVEQRALHPSGNAIAPCANSTSAEWYFADGFTAGGSTEQLVLTNPFSEPAIVDITFVTATGPRSPGFFQGYVIPPRAVRVESLAERGARDETVLGVSVTSTAGRFVAARAMRFQGAGRLGYSVTLGTPSLADQWYFADGQTGEGITEQFVVYNPGDEAVQADLVFLGLSVAAETVESVATSIPAGEVRVIDSSTVPGLGDGAHGAVVSTPAGSAVVAERVTTRPAAQQVATTVVMGAQFASATWYVPIGTDEPLSDVLTVLNVSSDAVNITLQAVTPTGLQPVVDTQELAGNGLVSLGVMSSVAVGRPLILTSSGPLVVEVRPGRGGQLRGRAGTLAVPT